MCDDDDDSDLDAFTPVEGDTEFEMKGGPFDKLLLCFDLAHAPQVIAFDAHVYVKFIQTWMEFAEEAADDPEYDREPDEIFITEYHYKNKQENCPCCNEEKP